MIQNRRRLAVLLASLTLTAGLSGLLWTVAAENLPEEQSEVTAVSVTEDQEATSTPVVGTQEPDPPSVTTEDYSDTKAPVLTDDPTVTDAPDVTEEPAVTDEPTVTEEPAVTDEPTVTEEPTVTDEPAVTEEPSGTDLPTTTESEPVTTPDIGTSALPVTTPELPPVTTDLPQTEETTTTTTKAPSTLPVISTDAPTSQKPISLSTDANTQIQADETRSPAATSPDRQDSVSVSESSVVHTEESGVTEGSGNSPSENRVNESRIGVIAVICSVLALISGLVLAVLKFIH